MAESLLTYTAPDTDHQLNNDKVDGGLGVMKIVNHNSDNNVVRTLASLCSKGNDPDGQLLSLISALGTSYTIFRLTNADWDQMMDDMDRLSSHISTHTEAFQTYIDFMDINIDAAIRESNEKAERTAGWTGTIVNVSERSIPAADAGQTSRRRIGYSPKSNVQSR